MEGDRMKWEYHFANIEHPDNTTGKHRKAELLNELGTKGWELVSVDNGMAYFKRPINECLPSYFAPAYFDRLNQSG